MNKLEFSTDSWHYWFIDKTTKYTRRVLYGNVAPDICSYTRAFIAGALKVLLFGIAISGVLTAVLSAITWWLSLLFKFSIWSWMVQIAHLGTVFLGVAVLTVSIMAIAALLAMLNDKRKVNRKDKGPTAAGEMYRAWKNKTCKQIEFK